jgi:hypothetical protein
MRMPQHRRLPRTINDLVQQRGTPPEGSMLAAAMKDNPYFGHAPDPKRELTDAQQRLFIEMLRMRADAYGKPTRRRTVRLGDNLDCRLEYFFKEYPGLRPLDFSRSRLHDSSMNSDSDVT